MFFLNILKNSITDRQYLALAEKRLRNARKNYWEDDTIAWIQNNIRHSNWQVRNIAVKLVELGKFTEFISVLAGFITNSSQEGFIRRNSARALYSFDSLDSSILKSFVTGLDDNYWEVRTESANGLQKHGHPDLDLTELLIRKIYRKPLSRIPCYPIFLPGRIFKKKILKFVLQCLELLVTVISDKKYIHALEIPLEEDIWKVREAALKAFVRASRRLGFSESHIQENLQKLDLTSTEFIPTFPIRQTYSILSDEIFNGTDTETDTRMMNHAL